MTSSLLVTNIFPPAGGGVETLLHHIASHFPCGEIAVMAPARHDSDEFDRNCSYPVHRINLPKTPVYRLGSRLISPTIARGISYFKRVADLHCSRTFSVLQTGTLQMGVTALLAKQRLRIPYVLYAYGDELLIEDTLRGRTAGRLLAERILAQSAAVFTISEFTRALLLQRKVPASKVFKLPVGAEPVTDLRRSQTPDLVRSLGLDDRTVILTISRLEKHKGHAAVLRALPAVLERIPNAIYVMAGTGSYEPNLRQLVSELGLESSVHFAGFVPDSQLSSYYALCDLFVMLSEDRTAEGRIEGFGLVYLEANAWGKPVLGTPVGGILDAVQHNVNGLLVRPDDQEAVANTMIRLLTDRELADRLGTSGRRIVETQRNWQAAADAAYKTIQQVAR